MGNYQFTSESVCAGHPDKICDQISDAIVDEVIRNDKNGRVAVETMVTKNRVIIVGEISTSAKIHIKRIAREQIKRLGYNDNSLHFTNKSPIEVYIQKQSNEIAIGVDNDGAGDQGLMFGYACLDTDIFMPISITIAHKLAYEIDKARETKALPYLRPDGKTQVTVSYKNGVPDKVVSVIVAVPHSEDAKLDQVKDDIYKKIILPTLLKYNFTIDQNHVVINGTGAWHIGGPSSDSGLTGRKIVVDTYGGYARVGGGCFSGKDPTKVDRSGAYAARYIAKNIVAAKLAEKVEVSLAYFIGAKKPVMSEIETFGSEKKSKKIISDFANGLLDTSVKGILQGLSLRRPLYLKTAAYGHFGREEFPWEKISKRI